MWVSQYDFLATGKKSLCGGAQAQIGGVMRKISISETVRVAKMSLKDSLLVSPVLLSSWVDQISQLEGWVEHLYPADVDEPILNIVDMRIEGNRLTYTAECPVKGLIATLDIKLMNLQLKHEFGTAMLVLEEKTDVAQSL